MEPSYLQVDTYNVYQCVLYLLKVQKEKRTLTKQDRRAQHLMKKVTKEVQMLKRNSPNSNALNFRYDSCCQILVVNK